MTDRTAKPTDYRGADSHSTVYRLWSDGSIRRAQPKGGNKKRRVAKRRRAKVAVNG